MNIEFHSPQGEVKEWLIHHVQNQLIELHHSFPAIDNVQVNFRGHSNGGSSLKICELTLMINGDSYFIHRMSESYEQSSRMVLTALNDRLKKQASLGMVACAF